jgi:hypothetical protein
LTPTLASTTKVSGSLIDARANVALRGGGSIPRVRVAQGHGKSVDVLAARGRQSAATNLRDGPRRISF